MPLNKDINAVNVRPPRRLRDPNDPITVTEQLSAAFELDNVVTSTVLRNAEPETADEPDFDPLDNLRPGEELLAREFADADSRAEMDLIRRRIERENAARATVAEGPMNSFLTTTIAVVADPTSFIPVGGALLKGGRLAGKLGAAAAGSALDVGLSEGALQATQQTRTAQESMLAIMFGGAFGLTVGGAAAGLTAARQAKVNKQIDAAIQDTIAMADDAFPGQGPTSAGAAVAPRAVAPQDSLLVGGKPTQAVIKAMASLKKAGLAAPSLELITSPFPKMREMAMRLVDTGLITKGAVKGVASPQPVDLRIRAYEGSIAAAATSLKAAHRKHKAAGGGLSRTKFLEEVGRAMRRGDQSPIPEVQAMAKELREGVFNPLKQEAINRKLLPEDVEPTTAPSYLSRVYNRERIRARRPEFKGKIVAWLRGHDAEMTRAEADDVADGIIDTILGNAAGRVPFVNIPAKRGPLRERTFNIPDDRIEDFLESDVLQITSRYVRTLAADIEFQKEFGKTNLDDIAKELQDDVNAFVEGGKFTEAQRASFLEQGKKEADLVQALGNRIRGVSDTPFDARFTGLRRTARVARNLNFARLLGSVVISSVPDIGRVVMEEGLARSFGTLFSDMGRGFKGIRMSIKEAQLAGTALDVINNQRAAMVMDLGERYAAETKFERGVEAATNVFSRLTLLDRWNTALKGWTSVMVSSRILGAAKTLSAGGELGARDIEKLALAGIDADMAKRIAKQAEHWDEAGNGVILGNTEAWTDPQAVSAFRLALLRDVDNTIITPGAGDAPLWTSTEYGKTIFQFKRFAAASTQRIMLSGLQRRDMAVLNGLMVMVALGGIGTALRDFTSKGEVRDRSASQWAADAVDRSGAMSILFEMDNIMEKFAGVSGVSSITGQEVSRFAGRDFLGQLAGPTAGLLSEMQAATTNALKGDFTQSDMNKFRRLMPGQNLFYLRHMLDQVEAGAAKGLGIPERATRGKSKKRAAVLPEGN